MAGWLDPPHERIRLTIDELRELHRLERAFALDSHEASDDARAPAVDRPDRAGLGRLVLAAAAGRLRMAVRLVALSAFLIACRLPVLWVAVGAAAGLAVLIAVPVVRERHRRRRVPIRRPGQEAPSRLGRFRRRLRPGPEGPPERNRFSRFSRFSRIRRRARSRGRRPRRPGRSPQS